MAAKLNWKILVVDDDEEDYFLVKSFLSSLNHVKVDWSWAKSARAGLEVLQSGSYDAVFIDYFLGSEDGLNLIQAAVQADIQTPMILLSGQGNYEMDMEAMHSGAYFYLDKNELSPRAMERAVRYAIERKEIERALKLREDKLRLLAELSKGFVAAGLDYHKVLHAIAEKVSETFSDGLIIRVLNQDKGSFEPAVSGHPDQKVGAQLMALLSQNPNDSLLEELGKTRQARILPRAEWGGPRQTAHSPFCAWLDRQQILNLLSVPLQVQDHALGAMILMRARQKPAFTQDDVEFFQELADRASLSIENARLYVEESEQTRHLQALQTATQALLRTLDFDQLTRKVLEAILKAIPPAGEATLYLQTPDSKELELQGIRCVRSQQTFNTFPLPGEVPVSAYLHQVINEGRSLKVDDQPFAPSQPFADPAESFLAVPLVMESEVYGVLTLTANQPAAFQQQDLNFLEDYSATIIAALHNARLHEQVQRMALTDPLTSLFNRRGFFNFASREFLRSQRIGKPISIIMLDIDHFKSINDTYGHTFGDTVLQLLAGKCMSHVRSIDLLGRFGGDEFIILLPDTRAVRAKMIAERIRLCFEELNFELEGDGMAKFSASFGIAQTDHAIRSLNELIAKADAALYASKHKGRNRVEVQTARRTPV